MPINFFLWGYVKCVDYKSTGQVDNVAELKHQITTAVVTVTPKMLSCVWDETEYRQDICHVTKGAHAGIY
jgi:hypothetical protein